MMDHTTHSYTLLLLRGAVSVTPPHAHPKMTPVTGTYDTQHCAECNLTLSGYKRGDKNMPLHILRNVAYNQRCQHVRNAYHGRLQELAILEGELRFQAGHVAFPKSWTSSTISFCQGNQPPKTYCVVCAFEGGVLHHPACHDLKRVVIKHVTSRTCAQPPTRTLFGNLDPHSSCVYNPLDQFSLAESMLFGNLDTDSSCVYSQFDKFAILGSDKANMIPVHDGSIDRHRCNTCRLEIVNFVEGDTLLGEHVRHSIANGTGCEYIRTNYSGDCLLTINGRERFRYGQMGLPSRVFNGSSHTVGGQELCIVCCATKTEAHTRGCYNVMCVLSNAVKLCNVLEIKN